MIQINLLPPELRKKVKRKRVALVLPKVRTLALVLGIGIAVGSVQGALWLTVGVVRWQAARMDRKVQNLSARKLELDRKGAEERMLRDKLWTVGELERPIIWSRKLNDLSDAMVRGVWLSRLSMEKKIVEIPGAGGKKLRQLTRSLILEGHALSMGEGEAATVAQFVKSLKSSASFMTEFSDVTVVSTKAEKLKSVPAMQFALELVFKEKVVLP